MKRIVCLLICLSLAICLCLPAGAEEDPQTLSLDRSRIQWAMAMTAAMAGNALEQQESAETTYQRFILKRFSQLPWAAPDKAIVLEFDRDQAHAAMRAIGVETFDWEDVAPQLAAMINPQFDTEYLQSARRSQSEGRTSLEYSRYFTLIVLPYGADIAVTSLTAYGSVNSRSSLIISTEEISQGLDAAAIDGYLEQLGIPDKPLVRVYEKEALDALLTRDPWGQNSAFNRLADALLSSEKAAGTLLPAFLQSDSPYLNSMMKLNLLVTQLKRMKTADLSAVRQLTEGLSHLSAETDAFFRAGGEAVDSGIAPPDIAYGETLHEAALKPGGAFLVVFERSLPEQETAAWLDLVLEAALPADHIPERPADADYIIRCSVAYEGGTSSGGVHLHYPLTRVTVHDAHTGDMLRDLGSVKRRLTGAVMLPKGDHWWYPLYSQVGPLVAALFAEE